MGLWLVSAKAALENASPAVKRSTPSVLKPCPGRGTASSARKRPKRACSKRHSKASGDLAIEIQNRNTGLHVHLSSFLYLSLFSGVEICSRQAHSWVSVNVARLPDNNFT